MSRIVLTVALLALVYALTLASLDPLDLLTGLVLGALARRAVRRVPSSVDPSTAPILGRILRFPAFLGGLLAEVAVGTWDVALRALHLRALERPGIVLVPIGERSALGVAVSALATTLSPGSLLVDIDWGRRVMLIHVIDATDPDGVRASHQRFYERYQQGVFP